MSIYEVATLPWKMLDATLMRISMLLGWIHRLFSLPLPSFEGNNEKYDIRPWYWYVFLTPWLRKHGFQIWVVNSHLTLYRRPTGPLRECHDNWEQLEYHIYDIIEEYKLSDYEKL